MLCCALGTVILAALALWRKRLRGLFTGLSMGRVSARTVVASLLVIGLALAGSLLVAEHFGHAIAAGDPATNGGPLCGGNETKE